MAKKNKVVYLCSECGYESPQWQGQCICGEWNTMKEMTVKPLEEKDSRRRSLTDTKPVKLNEVGTEGYQRIDTGINELNRVLGGGMVIGSLTLISGEPGIGKSTIIIQAANFISKKYGKTLYVSGEESEEQIKLRADRVCDGISDDLLIYSETNMERILAACENVKPKFLIIDSIQTVFSDETDSAPGSVSQIRTCGNLLMRIGKTSRIPIFIVAHVTKTGDLAGPKILEHLVDCVLNFTGERDQDLRILRAYKNRYGTTDEIGAFKMCEEGMTEVTNLSGSLLENTDNNVEGSVVSAIYEGSRAVFFEIQALVTPANVGFARRNSVGIDSNRVSMILAVLEKKVGLSLLNYDVYVNVVGGMKPDSTSTDLAVALAIYSSASGKYAAEKTFAVGEVGLTGDLRTIRNVDKIISESERLGYENVVLPNRNPKEVFKKVKIANVKTLNEAIKAYFKE
ncbi:MAG: DNA repair protein RadA [Peptostreptococcaceae bacterium]|nr:DNA repair protein RadA [Peptostreptococcaceae bacterium]